MSQFKNVEHDQLLIAPLSIAASEFDRIEQSVTASGGVVVGGFWRSDLERPAGGVLDVVRQLIDLIAPLQPEIVYRFSRILATALPDRFLEPPLAGQAELYATVPDFPLHGDRSVLIEFYQRRNRSTLTRSHLVHFVLRSVEALATAGRAPTLIRLEGAEQADRLAVDILQLLHHYRHHRGSPLIMMVQAERQPPGWDEMPAATEWQRFEREPPRREETSPLPDAAVPSELLAATVFSHPFGADELARLTGTPDAQPLLAAAVAAGWLRNVEGSGHVFRTSMTAESWSNALRAGTDDNMLARLHATALEIEAADPFAAAWHARHAGLVEETGAKSVDAMRRAWSLSAYDTALVHARWAIESPALSGVDPDLLLGLIYFEAEDYPEAERLLTAAWERQAPESVAQADLQWLVGYNAIFGLGEFDRGRELLQAVLERFQHEGKGKERECGYLRNSIAYALFRSRRLDRALEAENEVIQYIRDGERPDNFLLSLLQLNRGRLHRTLGDSEGALSEFEGGIQGQNAGLSPYMLALFHCSSGHVRMSRSEFGEGMVHYHHALNLVRSLELEATVDRMLYSISRHALKLPSGRATRGDLVMILLHLNLVLASRGLGLDRFESAYWKAIEVRRGLIGEEAWKALMSAVDEVKTSMPSHPPERLRHFDAEAASSIAALSDLIDSVATGDGAVDAVVDALQEGLAVAVVIPHRVGPGAARFDSFVLHDPRRPVAGELSDELVSRRLAGLGSPRSALTIPERIDLFTGLQPWPLILQDADLRMDRRAALPGIFPVQTRVQVLDPELDGLLHRIVASFADRTGCGALTASPFHLLGRPDLAADPREAVHDFLISSGDALLLGDRLLVKRHGAGAIRNLLPFRPNLNGLTWWSGGRETAGGGSGLFLRSHASGALRQVIKVRRELTPIVEMCDGELTVGEILEHARELRLVDGNKADDALCGFLRRLWLKGILCFDDPPVDRKARVAETRVP
jgi:tetratricopeptide (TPR) repeat protein